MPPSDAPPPHRYDRLYGALYARFDQRAHRVGSDALPLILSHQRDHATDDPPVPDAVLRVVTEARPPKGPATEVDFGDGRRTLSGRPGSVYLAPPDATAHWETEGSHAVMLLALPPDRIAALGGPSALAPRWGREWAAPQVVRTLRTLWQEAEAGDLSDPAGRLVADGLVTALTGLVARAGPARHDAEPALDGARLARVRALVEDTLEEGVDVAAMAEAACLSPSRFSRRFRAATGHAPHAWVMARRIARARRLLSDTDLPVVQVAAACGFGSQSHLTARFRRATGTTPAAWRAAARA
ncbi:helix-turn-helix transcriptional regulator [Jannaschia sp. Os4]|uniref:helix-turn-helix domain-containing protein n=1 Tax=Jannaschia sp. Os4 TaxID=2807617 RepID=UPI00193A2A7E|nr:AraC family transcriptional regulator [Jannaschia sp. Os4]MBM2575387.1 helix-turn-helix transcriptional regulator [Jannaschia sp. Os4]